MASGVLGEEAVRDAAVVGSDVGPLFLGQRIKRGKTFDPDGKLEKFKTSRSPPCM